MKRVLMSIGMVLAAAPAIAQTIPSGVAFDVHPTEHNSSIVSGYKVYVLTGTNTLRVSDIGKPAPSSGTISYVNPDLFAGLSPGSYSVHTTAYGPGGESGPSNKAAFSVDDGGTSTPSPPQNTEPLFEESTSTSSNVLVEAEHFDDGGQGVAYRDASPGNEGGAYRDTDVDIQGTSDSGGGYNVGWISAGEWLNYTVTVPRSGTYELQFRVASAGSGGVFHLEAEGGDRTGPLTVPDTGGWQVWTTIRKTVTMAAGTQLWRLVMDREGEHFAIGNINWIAAVRK